MKKTTAKTEFYECSLNQLTQITGMTHRTITKKLSDANVLPLRVVGRTKVFNTPDAVRTIFIKPQAIAKALDPEVELAKLRRQQRKKVKVERLKLKHSLVEAKLVSGAYQNMVFGFREKMLSIPSKLAGSVIDCESKLEAQVLIRDEIETALLELVEDANFIDNIIADE